MQNNILNKEISSCAILSFNHPEWTERAVKAALAVHPAEHIYLIHNGSEKKWITQHKNNFPKLNHLYIEKNCGFTGGTNFGLKYLFTDYNWVFFQTNDCLLVNSLVPPITEGFYAPLIYKRKIGRVDSLGAKFWPYKTKLRHCQSATEFNQKNILGKTYVPGTAFWIHKSIFTQVGFFDENLHTYWEDVDYSQRVHQLKLHLDIYPQTQLIHGVGKTCHKDPFYTNFLFQRNKKIISQKYTPFYLTPVLFYYLLIYYLRISLKKFNITKKVKIQDLK
jgi:GT2 family glycosyltransferase